MVAIKTFTDFLQRLPACSPEMSARSRVICDKSCFFRTKTLVFELVKIELNDRPTVEDSARREVLLGAKTVRT